MTEKRFILIEGFKKGTHTGIWDKWKQNNQRVGDELWLGEVVAMLNEGVAIADENEQLKKLLEHSHCRKCIHFSCDSADNYCMKKEYDSISDCNIAEHCTDYESVFE